MDTMPMFSWTVLVVVRLRAKRFGEITGALAKAVASSGLRVEPPALTAHHLK